MYGATSTHVVCVHVVVPVEAIYIDSYMYMYRHEDKHITQTISLVLSIESDRSRSLLGSAGARTNTRIGMLGDMVVGKRLPLRTT